MIYDPSAPYLHLRYAPAVAAANQILRRGIVTATTVAAIDLARDVDRNSPWFYAGVALGGAAVATGWPYAAATLYVVGDVLSARVFKSEKSSNLDILLNGVSYGSLETFAAAQVWDVFQVNLESGLNRVDFVSQGPGPNNITGTGPDAVPVTAIGQIEITGGDEELLELPAAEDVMKITYTIRDDKGAKGYHSIYVPHPGYGADIEDDPLYLAQVYAEFLDERIYGQIVNCTVTMQPSLTRLSNFAASAADVEEKVRLYYASERNHNDDYYHDIPTADHEADLEMYHEIGQFLTTGGGQHNLRITDRRGNYLFYRDAKRVFKASR